MAPVETSKTNASVGLTSFRVLLVFVFLFLLPAGVAAQQPAPGRYRPPQLQANDRDVAALLKSAETKSNAGDYDGAFSDCKTAVELADKKGLVADRGIAEDTVAAGYFEQGKLDEAEQFFQASLQDATDSSNLVLQADVLVALSGYPQLAGNVPGALQLLHQALDRANQSKDLYIKSRVLGELGRLQIVSGQVPEGRASLEQALSIDQTNGYQWEALHRVYVSYAWVAQQKPDYASAISELESAQNLALQKENDLALLLAETTLGGIYIRSGQPAKGVAVLEAIQDGNVLRDGKTVETPRSFRLAAKLAYSQAVLWEALAQGYDATHQDDKALHAWGELYWLSTREGSKVGEAEAASRMAMLYKGKGDTKNAVLFFGRSIEAWRQLGNDQMLSQMLISDSLTLIQARQGKEAVPLENELLELARKHQDRKTEFTANMVLAEIYQPGGMLQEARGVLEKAEALIQPGPQDSEIDGKAVLETYVRLADLYKSLELPLEELVSLEKEITVIQALKDTQSLDQVVPYVAGRLAALKARELAESDFASGNLTDSLKYSEVVYVFDGAPATGTTSDTWTRVLNLPFRVVELPGGPDSLEEVVSEMGSILNVARLPILDALAGHFATSDVKPQLAEKYASEAIAVVEQMPNHPEPLLFRPTCQLTLAYAQEGKVDLAKQKARECMTLGEKAGDDQSKDLANFANAMAQLSGNDPSTAELSLEYMLKKRPDEPELHLDVAMGLFKQGLTDMGLAEFKETIKILESKKDLNAEAAAYDRMAAVLGGSPPQFRDQQLKFLNTAEDCYRRAGNPTRAGTVLMELGNFESASGNRKVALRYFEDADKMAEQANDFRLSAWASSMIANVYFQSHNYKTAIDFHNRALALDQKLGDRSLQQMTLVAVALDQEGEGRLDDAVQSCERAKELADPVARNADYWVRKTFGEIYERQGEFEKAAAAFQSGADIADSVGAQQDKGYVEIELADTDTILGLWDDALGAANAGLGTFRDIHDQPGEALANAELANIFGDRSSSLRDFDKARAYYATAQQLGYADNSDLVEIDVQTQRYSDAVKAAQIELTTCTKAENAFCEAHAFITLSEAQRKAGDISAAALSLREAQQRAAKINDLYLQGRLLYGQAGQQRAEGHFEQAAASYEKLVTLLETTKGQGDLKTERSVAESYDFIYDELLSTLFAMSGTKTGAERTRLVSLAFEYAETNKARQFAETWGRSFVTELRQGLPSDVAEKERSLLAARTKLLANAEDPHATTELEKLNEELAAFAESLRTTHPQYAAVAYPQPVTLDHLPVRTNETIVEFKVMDDQTLVWIIGNPKGTGSELLDFYQANEPRQWFRERVSKLRTALNSANPEAVDWRNAEDLFHELFPNTSAQVLLQSKHIVFVPDDVLAVLPFELLSPDATKGAFPLLSIPTSYYPSAATLELARAASRPTKWPESFLGIGDPITSPEDDRYQRAQALARRPAPNEPGSSATSPSIEQIQTRGLSLDRLPGTAVEVEDIAKLFESRGQVAESRLGAAATKEKLVATDLSKFRFLHFATHGLLPVDSNVKEPALVFSFDGTSPAHMLLSMSEILNLKIDADTVVLSACNTGSGVVSRAEGVMSLGRAFLAAGAESVTVSLWQVSDNSTQVFMEQYYENILDGMSKSEALAAARSYLFKNGFANPFFWAPFVLVGD
jgi:CHAT domain-containing protein